MPRTLTVRNRKHPHNIMHEVGQIAKEHVRKFSNEELDKFFTDTIENQETLAFVLSLNRSKKIKWVKDNAMAGFVKEYKAGKEGKEDESTG